MAGDATTDFLKHYGIPGMKWGKRKTRPTYEKSVRTFGGDSAHRNLPSSPKSIDAMKSRNYQQRVRNAGTDALSTKELKALVERQNLESQYSRLNPAPVSAGAAIMSKLMPVAGAVLSSQWQAHQEQKPKAALETSMDLVPYRKPSTGKLVATVIAATGKQVIAEHGFEIAMAIGKSLLK